MTSKIIKMSKIESKYLGYIPYLKNNNKYIYVNQNSMEPIIGFGEYEEAGLFKDTYACVKNNGKYGIIDINGKEIIPCKYNNIISSFSEGPICVNLNGKIGFINLNEDIVIPF